MSLAPVLIPKINEAIRSISKGEMEILTADAQRLGASDEVRALAAAKS